MYDFLFVIIELFSLALTDLSSVFMNALTDDAKITEFGKIFLKIDNSYKSIRKHM